MLQQLFDLHKTGRVVAAPEAAPQSEPGYRPRPPPTPRCSARGVHGEPLARRGRRQGEDGWVFLTFPSNMVFLICLQFTIQY